MHLNFIKTLDAVFQRKKKFWIKKAINKKV